VATLFEPIQLKGLTLSNRFVRSATWEGMAGVEGACSDGLVKLMRRLAAGGMGLIISSHAYVREEGQAQPWQLGLYTDDHIAGLSEMTRAVHQEKGRIVLQLSHAGIIADPWKKDRQPLAISLVDGFAKSPPREMTAEDIGALVEAFAQAAGRAKAAGFDGVQIHASHGYLLSQSLSPVFNRRSDGYGGTVDHRARFVLEVLQAVRTAVGRDYPVLIKLNSQDFMEGGLRLEDSLQTAVLLQEGGIDAIELSGGTFFSGAMGPVRKGINAVEKEAYFKDAARAFKDKLHIALMLVGGIRSYAVAEQLVTDGTADYISMSRPFIREPDLVKRWKMGDREKAACISDILCGDKAYAGEGIQCVVEQRIKAKMRA